MPNILFFGDNHSRFDHIITAVERGKPDAIILLGDIQARRPLEFELAPIHGKTVIRFIHGNHDTDTDFDFRHILKPKLAHGNLLGRVEGIAGVRIAGLGGIFRGKVWMPPANAFIHQFGRMAPVALLGTAGSTYGHAGTNCGRARAHASVDHLFGRLPSSQPAQGRRPRNVRGALLSPAWVGCDRRPGARARRADELSTASP